MGAPRKAHNARKVSGSSGRPPPRNEALGWPLAHLAWADLRLMRDSGRPASPAHPSCSWGREEELPWWGGLGGGVGGLWGDLAWPAGAPLVLGSGGLGDHPGYPWGHSSRRPAPAGGPVPLSTWAKCGQAVPAHEPPLPCCPGPRRPPQPPGRPGGSCVGTSGLRPADTSGCLVAPAPARPSLLTGSPSPSPLPHLRVCAASAETRPKSSHESPSFIPSS